jgi:hypothetical protein
VSLKQDLERELKVPVKLKLGRPGALNVYADGQQVYSYQRTKKYPVTAQIIELLRSR